MAYSTLKRKHCNCSTNCERWPSFGCNGKNYNCLTDEEKQVIGSRNKVAQKKHAYNNAQSRMIHIAQKKAEQKEEGTPAWKLVLFYASAAIELAKKPFCENCGAFISPAYYRAATAHILPKKEDYGFPSVAAHPKNRLFLGGGCGCHNLTHRWDTFSKMKVWPVSVKLFLVKPKF